MSERFAIYLSFPAGDPLTKAAAAWLGRDAFGGAVMQRPDLPALTGIDLEALTEDPRRYGFHATLKAPFELAQGTDADSLRDALAAFAARQSGFTIDLAVTGIGSFIAITLATPSPAMQGLHEACVEAFEPFRAPLSAFDLARRGGERLPPERAAMLERYGYAGVFEYFRFHMTLTGRIDDPGQRSAVLAALQSHFAPHCGPRHVTHLALFRQTPDRTAPFVVDSFAELGREG